MIIDKYIILHKNYIYHIKCSFPRKIVSFIGFFNATLLDYMVIVETRFSFLLQPELFMKTQVVIFSMNNSGINK